GVRRPPAAPLRGAAVGSGGKPEGRRPEAGAPTAPSGRAAPRVAATALLSDPPRPDPGATGGLPCRADPRGARRVSARDQARALASGPRGGAAAGPNLRGSGRLRFGAQILSGGGRI